MLALSFVSIEQMSMLKLEEQVVTGVANSVRQFDKT